MPVTCEAVENSPDESSTKPKPVMAVAAMGETPMSPKRVELATLEIPLFERMTKLQADPRSIGVDPLRLLLGFELGSSLGATSPSTVGDRLREELGELLGDLLGDLLGELLGDLLGDADGA